MAAGPLGLLGPSLSAEEFMQVELLGFGVSRDRGCPLWTPSSLVEDTAHPEPQPG